MLKSRAHHSTIKDRFLSVHDNYRRLNPCFANLFLLNIFLGEQPSLLPRESYELNGSLLLNGISSDVHRHFKSGYELFSVFQNDIMLL